MNNNTAVKKTINQLYTTEEIATYLKVSTKTIYQWAELRKIPSRKLCGCLRFDIDDINEWLLSCKSELTSGTMGIAQTVAVPKKGRCI